MRALPLVGCALFASSCAAMLKQWQDSHCSYDAAYSDGRRAVERSQPADAAPYGSCTPETREAAQRGYREGYSAGASEQAAAAAQAHRQWLDTHCNYDAAMIDGGGTAQSGEAADVTPYGECPEPQRSEALRGYRIGFERAARQPPPPSSGPLTATTIVNESSGKCLDASPRGDGPALQIWSCDGGVGQGFGLRPLPGGQANLVHLASGRCVDVGDGRPRLWRCTGAPSQAFSRVDLGQSGPFRLVSAASASCVDVQDHAWTEGAPITLARCDNSNSQHWRTP